MLANKASFKTFEKDSKIEFDWSFFQFSNNYPILPSTPPVITTPSSLTYSMKSDSPSQLFILVQLMIQQTNQFLQTSSL
jgi:hypothetical protein